MTITQNHNRHPFAGYSIGNVANAETFDYPVPYEVVDIDLELLFKGDKLLNENIIAAAKKLEASGVRAIIGACGFFANSQNVLKEAVSIPVFTSSLLQVPLIESSLAANQKIAVFAANGENIQHALAAAGNTNTDRYVLVDVNQLEEFAPIRYGKKPLDNETLKGALANLAKKAVETDPSIGAILLECSDLPPICQSRTG